MFTFLSRQARPACWTVIAVGFYLFVLHGRLVGGGQASIDFDRQIRPILADKCYTCHGPNEASREGGFHLDNQDSAFSEADSGEHPIVPGDPESSEVYLRLTSDDEDVRMPPADSRKSLTPEEIQLVRTWIEQGAAWQQHWAFIPPHQVALPDVKNKSWPQTPIDVFILDRLETEGLAPMPPADKRTLIRRVTFDLTGLPPTLADVHAFLADESEDAYERVVDRLLDSQSYGEHMARVWLDAARYSDTHGLHLDNYREIWPYRDWVVRAFNKNLPFDQFTIKQLAGDLLPDPTIDDLIATGFNRCHVTTNEGGSIPEEVFVRNVVDRVVTTGTVFLGLTLECSRCHDHKYDPITMRDVYSLFAFFNSLDGNAMDGNKARHAPIITLPTQEQATESDRLKAEIASLQREITDAVASVKLESADHAADARESSPQTAETVTQAADTENEEIHDSPSPKADYSLAAWMRDQRDAPRKDLPGQIAKAIKVDERDRSADQQSLLQDYFIEHVYAPTRETFAALHDELNQLETSLEKLNQQIPATMIYKERDPPRPSYVLHRGEYDQRRDEVSRATPAALPPLPEGAPLNRLGLAQWLVGQDHPLTARVTVNRLWQQVFGTGIVKTAEDFGSQGEPPSHPDLLDWLAVQFQEDGWDVKAMMKRFVMSAVYRQSSQITPQLAQRDSANRLLARGPRYRLDAEMLRDQALAVSGLLVNQLGGPSVKPPQPSGLWLAVGYSGSNTVRFKADESADKIHRRTLYTFIKRTAPPPQLNTFDAPSREFCTVRRERTNTPLQALLLLNDPQYVESARALAIRTVQECDSTIAARVAYMFELCTARPPNAWETRELVRLYKDHLKHFESDAPAAAELVRGVADDKTPGSEIPNSDASLNVSELAAWTMAANLMLNLDEVINKN